MAKKKFFETGIGKFLKSAAPNLLDVVDDIFPPAKLLTKLIQNDPDMTPEQKAEALRLNQEYEKEMYEIEVRDRESARHREVEMAKTNRTDWMMYAAGLTALGTFLLMVWAVIFRDVSENALFHQLMGVIEGVALTVFGYYFGTSKGSSDKTKLLSKQ